MREYIITVQGSRDTSVRLPETPLVGSIVRTNAYFNYKVQRVMYDSGKDSITLEGERYFK